MTLTVDPNTHTNLSPELSKNLVTSKQVVRLSRKSKVLTQKLKEKYHVICHALPNNLWLKAKKQVDAALHHERNNR